MQQSGDYIKTQVPSVQVHDNYAKMLDEKKLKLSLIELDGISRKQF